MNKNLAIKINNLFKTYDNVKAVQGIDLEINKGEFYGLLGPNGAGTVSYTHLTLPTIYSV